LIVFVIFSPVLCRQRAPLHHISVLLVQADNEEEEARRAAGLRSVPREYGTVTAVGRRQEP
jgi:hypothetical protein